MAVASVSLLSLIGTLLIHPSDPAALLLFCLLVASSEWMTATFIEGQTTLSIASAVSFAAALLFSPMHAGLVGAVGGATAALINARQRRFKPRYALQVVFSNAGMNALATIFGALVFQSLYAGRLTQSPTLDAVLPLFIAALVDDQINAIAVVTMIALQTGQRAFTIWRENFAWYAPINVITMAVGGGALVLGFNGVGLTGLVVFFLPVILSAYSFRAYIIRTKALMSHLEDMVQQRTAELAEANDALRELNRQKDAFFAVITHDMRSPLTSMMGFAELLDRHGSIEPSAQSFLAAIKRNTESLSMLVNDILDLAKLDSNKMEYKRERLDLTQVINDVVLNTSGQAANAGITVHCDVRQTPQLIGDEEKLRRVATNLLSNALKYTPEGGEVFVGLCAEGDQARLVVRDTGYGIPADELPHIFERFRRVNRAEHRRAVGTGLGLSIVREFVHAHNGEIEVHSQIEVGSTFTVTLPLNLDAPSAPA
jgi:signal transduction histidine kinase